MLGRTSKIFKTSMNHPEYQYLNLLRNVITDGEEKPGRNGITKSIFGNHMRFPLYNTIPILTTKKMAWKTCLKELFWFIKGETSNTILKDQNVNIWNDNASREFLDSQGLYHLKEDDLGPVYGHQWRFFNAPYIDAQTNYEKQGVDQLQYIINNLKDPVNRYSRRLLMSAWNPNQLNDMALPPCHVLCQFHVNTNDELSCALYQRSADIGLGVPFNIASYSFLTHILAKHCGLKAKEFNHFIGDAHIYLSHEEHLITQLSKKPKLFPTIEIVNTYDNINDYTIEDIIVSNYKSENNIKMKMIP